MSPTQMKLMSQVSSLAVKCAQAASAAKAWLASRQALVVAAVILLLALLLRYYGVM